METDIEGAANHPCQVKKKSTRTAPRFHSSVVKAPGCPRRPEKMVPDMLGRKLWVLPDLDNFDFQTVVCSGGSFHPFAPWMCKMSDTEEHPAVQMDVLSSWAGSEL